MIRSDELKSFLEAIRFAYGYDFTEYSEASVLRRIEQFMKLRQFDTFKLLAKALLHDERLFASFVQEFTVNVTEMFRDPSFYESLRKNVMKRLATYPVIKIWVAGCSTGEEVYSLAIMLKEEGLLHRSIIYATDINQRSLQTAREGIVPLQQMKTYTANYQKAGGKASFSDYYMAKYNSALMDKSLKQSIVFSIHNLTVDKSFNEFQLIMCRNVLIYFNQALQSKVINLFYESLCPFGFLALGNKESLLFSADRKRFSDTDKKEKIFMKMA